jgi:hypothetical protein
VSDAIKARRTAWISLGIGQVRVLRDLDEDIALARLCEGDDKAWYAIICETAELAIHPTEEAALHWIAERT